MPSLDPADLRHVFGRSVSSYEIEPIDPQLRIHSVTGGVYRVRAGEDSCVVKVVRRGVDGTPDGLWVSGADAGHRNYWKREWLAFDSGLLDLLPGQLRAPRALLTTEHDEQTCWIWMEDVSGRTGSALTLPDLDAIAFSLGTTHGAYASGRVELPDEPWLSHNWLRSWVDTCAGFVDALSDDDRWRDERLAPLLPMRERVVSLWSRRAELLEIADEPPLVIAHWDLWPANLFVTDSGEANSDRLVAGRHRRHHPRPRPDHAGHGVDARAPGRVAGRSRGSHPRRLHRRPARKWLRRTPF